MSYTKGTLIAEPKLSELGNKNPRYSVGVRNGRVLFTVDSKNGVANALHLVKCWNSHDKLLEACKKLISFCESKERLNDDGICPVEAYESAQAAIAAAEKG